jgi:hypothetical protein
MTAVEKLQQFDNDICRIVEKNVASLTQLNELLKD